MNLYELTCEAFVKKSVEFIVVGGFAVNYWGYNRSTGDLDFLINSTPKNLEALIEALDYLGFQIDNQAKKAIDAGELIQFKDRYHIVELLFRINVQKPFNELLNNASFSSFGSVEVPFLDFDDLILEKLKSKREKDLLDVYELKKLRGQL